MRVAWSLLFCVGLLLIWRGAGEAPVTEAQPATSTGSPMDQPAEMTAPSVRIEHRFVHPRMVSAPAPARLARSVRQAPPVPQVRKTAQPESESPRFVSRARRLLFGDGTSRPEPFPRPGRD